MVGDAIPPCGVPSPALLTGFGKGIVGPSPDDQFVVADLQEDEFIEGENGLALPAERGGREGLFTKESKGTGPGVLAPLFHEDEFPAERGVIEAMGDVEGEGGTPAVVNETPPKAGAEVERGESESAPVRMDSIPGERGS